MTRFALHVVVFLIAATTLFGQCALSPSAQRQLAATDQAKNHPAYDYQRGVIFEAAGCLREARDSFSATLRAATPMPQNDREALQLAASSMLKIVQAEEDLRAARQAQALAALWDVVDTVRQRHAYPRAIQILTATLPQNDPANWKRLEEHLSRVSNEFAEWQAYEPVLRHQRRTGDPQGAYTALGMKLSEPVPLQQAAGLELLYVEFLIEDKRLPEATVLFTSLEPRFAEKVLDPAARLRLLRAGATIFSLRPGSESAARARTYAQLAADYDRRLKEFY